MRRTHEVRNDYGYPAMQRMGHDDKPAVHALYVLGGVLLLAAIGYIGWSSVIRTAILRGGN